MEHPNLLSGFLLIDKPPDITSSGCINWIKRFLPKKTKIGHAGTLDRFATGLLLVAIGRSATKQLTQFKELDKTYIFTAQFGHTTDTLDSTGTIIENRAYDHITETMIRETLASFGNSYRQVPPLYSALKHQGKRLSTLARGQKIIEQELHAIAQSKTREVMLHSLELQEFKLPYVTIKAHVSSGTYIRSLVQDIAHKMNTVAVTHQLRRTTIGDFTIEKAVELYELISWQKIKGE